LVLLQRFLVSSYCQKKLDQGRHERLQDFMITDYTNEYAVAYARAHIVRKTGVQGQVGLTKYAARMGLIDLDLWN